MVQAQGRNSTDNRRRNNIGAIEFSADAYFHYRYVYFLLDKGMDRHDSKEVEVHGHVQIIGGGGRIVMRGSDEWFICLKWENK